jgi:hypothetical protein
MRGLALFLTMLLVSGLRSVAAQEGAGAMHLPIATADARRAQDPDSQGPTVRAFGTHDEPAPATLPPPSPSVPPVLATTPASEVAGARSNGSPAGAASGGMAPAPAQPSAPSRMRTILPMDVPGPRCAPSASPFRGAGTPATVYCPLPFYHLTKYVSPFRPRGHFHADTR